MDKTTETIIYKLVTNFPVKASFSLVCKFDIITQTKFTSENMNKKTNRDKEYVGTNHNFYSS